MRYGLVGASGRMGGEIRKAFAAHELTFTLDVGGETLDAAPQVLLDFSLPAAFPATVAVARRFACPLVIGTTGLSAEQLGELRTLGEQTAVVQSFNFATGVTLLKMMLREFAPLFSDWDVEISETHHNKKKDAPSGTAILFREGDGAQLPDALAAPRGDTRRSYGLLCERGRGPYADAPGAFTERLCPRRAEGRGIRGFGRARILFF